MTWSPNWRIEPPQSQAMSQSDVDWASMLRPSVVSGLVRLRKRIAESPGLTADEARKVLLASYDNSGVDFDGAISMHEMISVGLTEGPGIFRAAITMVVERSAPPWSALLRRGRDALRGLDPDTVACFDRAGAFAHIPEPDVLLWWDALAAKAYADRDLDLCTRGREAERRSLEYERLLIKDLPGAPTPVWRALDSNLAGYDVLSSMMLAGALRPKLIEVKGSARLPLRFHVTRNEWDTAIRNPQTYFFQVWHLATDHMVELSVDEAKAHMPLDRGCGLWQDVVVDLPAR